MGLTLAKKMGVDADALIQDTEEQDHRLQRYSKDFPAFKGVIEFDLTVEVFGQRVTRKARAEYSYTPAWPYFDLQKQAPFEGWSMLSMGVEFLTVPKDDGDMGEPKWESVGILDIGAVWNIIEDAIEERCKLEDAERRRLAAAQRAAVKSASKRRH